MKNKLLLLLSFIGLSSIAYICYSEEADAPVGYWRFPYTSGYHHHDADLPLSVLSEAATESADVAIAAQCNTCTACSAKTEGGSCKFPRLHPFKDDEGYSWWYVANQTKYRIKVRGSSKRIQTLKPKEETRVDHSKGWKLTVIVYTPKGPKEYYIVTRKHTIYVQDKKDKVRIRSFGPLEEEMDDDDEYIV